MQVTSGSLTKSVLVITYTLPLTQAGMSSPRGNIGVTTALNLDFTVSPNRSMIIAACCAGESAVPCFAGIGIFRMIASLKTYGTNKRDKWNKKERDSYF